MQRLLLTLILLPLFVACHATTPTRRPNIILLMADDLGYGDLACQGHAHLHTPHLDALAASGARFTRFHAAAPVCSPTRASVLTGRHPYRCGIPYANTGHLRAKERSLQGILKRHRYRTGHFGKWHLGTLTETVRDANRGGPRGVAHFAPPWQRDFDVCFSTESKVPTFDPMRHPTSGKPYGTRYWDTSGREVIENLAGDDSRVIMDRVVPFVKTCAEDEQPFFAVVWFHAPHLPVVASEADRARYRAFDEHTQHYYGCITALDREVGRLRAELARLGIADDTIVWFCSDNGPEGKRDSAPGSAGKLRGRKRSLYDGGTRVPGLLAWPARIPAATTVETVATTSDMLPTIASWLDLEVAANATLDGINLAPLIADAAQGHAHERPTALGFESQRMATWVEESWKLVAHLAKTPKAQPAILRLELFDLDEDPSESNDLAATNELLVAAMRGRLEQWREAIRRRP